MALPTYATTGQRIGYYSFLTYCGFVFFFLIAPIFIILPLSFSASPFFEFTREFMHFEPEAYSLRWYRQMVGISSIGDTTVVSNKWMLGTRNSFIIGLSATFLATALGTVAALGLSRPSMPFMNGMLGLLKPKAATVPNAVAKNVAESPMIKLFLVPNIHLLDTTVVSPILLIPTICLYHLSE